MRTLIQLTETDKRIIFALFIIVILLFVIIGYIGFIVTRVMKKQGQKLDTKVYDVVVTRVINNKKDFKAYAKKKNWRMFYKSAQIPVLILAIAGFLVFIHFLVNDFQYGLFDPKHGFSTLLFLWDFDNVPKVDFFGMEIISGWPKLYEDIGRPEFVVEAIPSYFAVLGITVGGCWYLFEVQALIARRLRIGSLCDSIFEKSLEGFNINNQFANQMNIQNQMNNPQVQQPVQPTIQQVPPQQPQVQQQPQKESKFPFWRR